MKYEIQKVKFDFSLQESRSVKVLEGCIPSATPYHHTVLKGSSLALEPGEFHHILTVLKGDVRFSTDGNEYVFHERVTFVPGPDKSVRIEALSDLLTAAK